MDLSWSAHLTGRVYHQQVDSQEISMRKHEMLQEVMGYGCEVVYIWTDREGNWTKQARIDLPRVSFSLDGVAALDEQ